MENTKVQSILVKWSKKLFAICEELLEYEM